MAWVTAFIYSKNSSIEKKFNSVVLKENIHEAVLFVENTAGDFTVSFGYGGRDIDSPMVIASITKMFTATCILKLYEEGILSLDDKISLYIDAETLKDLHIYKSREYSDELTISDLLFQTSGLPDYFVGNIARDIIEKGDRYITIEELVAETKKLPARFVPNTNKAYYADINFDLLGIILENIIELPLERIYEQFIFAPLGMTNTYLPVYGDPIPHTFYGSEKIERPLYITSCRASGGCISTARDMMSFSKAFWGGELFGKDVSEQIANYKKLQIDMTPIQYGGGYMRIPLTGLNTFFLANGELVGHSGSTGSFMFYYPEKDLHIIGDLTQFSNPGLAVCFIMQLVMVI